MSYQQYSPSGFRLLPPVVKNLLIINGLCFLATVSFQSAFGIDLENLMGLHFFKSELFRPYQFVTYMFFHANLTHIFFNMFALWMFGYLLENVWGPRRFLFYYLVTGIGAAVVQTLVMWWSYHSMESLVVAYSQSPSLNSFISIVSSKFPQYYDYSDTIKKFITGWKMVPGDPGYLQQSVDYLEQLIKLKADIPTIGASGAVFGILLAFGMMFPNMMIYIYFLFPIRAKWFVLGYGVLELVSGILTRPGDNVAHYAHLGGMIFGFFLILYWRKRSRLY
ncbi:MAG TPA: rhomboid family intramembrane serine protease [Bacteroidales bacterium]|nr:rhomboid family intramembrane serine protease [Bacteroidales bacterium]